MIAPGAGVTGSWVLRCDRASAGRIVTEVCDGYFDLGWTQKIPGGKHHAGRRRRVNHECDSLSGFFEAERVGQGALVEVDISKIEPGQQITVTWRKTPVWVLRRTPEILERIDRPEHLEQLLDPNSEVTTQQPDYALNSHRSIRDEYFIVVSICTHLGCVPTFRPEVAPADLGPDWPGGYFCPCHGSRFDFAGRVFKGVPAPKNLLIPPYRFLSDTHIEIGVDHGTAQS